ncbi:hypothetical protein [Kineosporia babensis]|uniref:Uncharacterized protein n=1 Tax=Kineosporia babensis TaxID=499548 RepID=A0A9X1NHS0_9ACTN|nr:hypothetical protein [Kineosporia babensis]MCD5313353.1 hypothetical protein [Kineosporia babensis]
MTDDELLAQRLRGQMDEELGDIQVRAGSRERLRQGMRKEKRVPWLRPSIMVPVGAATAIAATVLAIPLLLNQDDQQRVEVVPAGPPAVSSVPAEPAPTPTESAVEKQPKVAPSAEPSSLEDAPTDDSRKNRTPERTEPSQAPVRETESKLRPDAPESPTAATEDPTEARPTSEVPGATQEPIVAGDAE